MGVRRQGCAQGPTSLTPLTVTRIQPVTRLLEGPDHQAGRGIHETTRRALRRYARRCQPSFVSAIWATCASPDPAIGGTSPAVMRRTVARVRVELIDSIRSRRGRTCVSLTGIKSGTLLSSLSSPLLLQRVATLRGRPPSLLRAGLPVRAIAEGLLPLLAGQVAPGGGAGEVDPVRRVDVPRVRGAVGRSSEHRLAVADIGRTDRDVLLARDEAGD